MGWGQRIFWTLSAGGGVYVALIFALTFPQLQRIALYANKVNPSMFQNLSNVDQFGFYHHQVQPFRFTTPDNTSLFAWHILPTHLYRQHATELKAQTDFGMKPFELAATGLNLRLLLEDPNAHVVVYFHGNAGHLATSYRPATFQNIISTSTAAKPVHAIAFDYRGFGMSEGSPSEAGVVQDGVALISHLTGYQTTQDSSSSPPSSKPITAKTRLSPSRIILMGHSLGTFVSTATLEYWTLQLNRQPLKALMLYASFSNIPRLIESYSIKGLTPPILSPLTGYPKIQEWFTASMIDKLNTSQRLTNLIKAPNVPFDLTMIHSRDDFDIPWPEGRRNWETVMNAADGSGRLVMQQEKDIDTGMWVSEDKLKRVTWERIAHGGHNQLPTSEQAKVALMDVLER